MHRAFGLLSVSSPHSKFFWLGFHRMSTPEELARQNIDKLLTACGWIIQKRSEINFAAGRGIAISEGLLKGGDEVDYLLFFDRKPAAEKPWTERLWLYDLRTNKHFTLKENPLKRSDLDDFVACYNPKDRHERKESERFKSFAYEDLLKRDKLNLDILWLKDESLEDSANLPDPDIIAAEIVEDLQAALAQFAEIATDLSISPK
jgi:hypothetical protein